MSEAAVATAPGSGAVVLVTDDDPTSRLLIGAALQGHVREIHEAENGLEGVRALSGGNFDLAIVDLDMPVMNGFGFIERARARPETRDLPIIVVTSRDDVVAIERAYALGATSFLCKPLNWNIFRYQVAYVLQAAQRERDRRLTGEEFELRALFHARASARLQQEAEHVGDVLGSDAAERDAARERLSKLLARIRRMEAVIAGATTLDLKSVPIGDVVAASLDLVGGDLGHFALGRVRVEQQADYHLICEPRLAVEALAQVVENALRFSSAEAPVTVRVIAAGPNLVRLEIADRGEGIPIAVAASDGGAGSPVERLGLGLLLARSIVERHGGHFGIMSEPGQGTEVFLNFPAVLARAATGQVGT